MVLHVRNNQPTHALPNRVGIAILVALVVGLGAYAFTRTPLFASLTNTRLVYSQPALLNETWATYKADSIESGSGRTIDSHATNVTTSRAHSDTLLRSVYIDDKAAFDAAWKWSKQADQLDNKLFAGSYGPRADKTYGIITTVTDSRADTDTALALLLAYGRWNNPAYLTDAEAIINALYVHSVVLVNGSPVMADTALTGTETQVRVSPETLNLAAFKEFAKVDPSHDWTGLVNNSYATYGRLLALNNNVLPSSTVMTVATGAIAMTQQEKVFTGTGATGVWNLGFDYAWNKDSRDLALMKKLTVNSDAPLSSADYGKLMPYFTAVDPARARTILSDNLTSQYSQDQQAWRTSLNVNAQTWIWNGIAFANSRLPQLTEIKS